MTDNTHWPSVLLYLKKRREELDYFLDVLHDEDKRNLVPEEERDNWYEEVDETRVSLKFLDQEIKDAASRLSSIIF